MFRGFSLYASLFAQVFVICLKKHFLQGPPSPVLDIWKKRPYHSYDWCLARQCSTTKPFTGLVLSWSSMWLVGLMEMEVAFVLRPSGKHAKVITSVAITHGLLQVFQFKKPSHGQLTVARCCHVSPGGWKKSTGELQILKTGVWIWGQYWNVLCFH